MNFSRMIAFSASCFLGSSLFQKILRHQLAGCLRAINQLQINTLIIYLRRDYLEKNYFYEKELHYKRRAIFSLMQKTHCWIDQLPSAKKDKFEILFEYIGCLLEIVIALGSLRYRVQDYSIFEVCHQEMLQVAQQFSTILVQLSHQLVVPKKIDFIDFLKSIDNFERVFEKTLEVVSKQPEIFLIFIRELRDVCAECQLISDENSS